MPKPKTIEQRMMRSISCGYKEEAIRCIEAGADVDYVDAFGVTPLLKSCREGSEPVLRALLARGANYYQIESNGMSLLHHLAGMANLSDDPSTYLRPLDIILEFDEEENYFGRLIDGFGKTAFETLNPELQSLYSGRAMRFRRTFPTGGASQEAAAHLATPVTMAREEVGGVLKPGPSGLLIRFGGLFQAVFGNCAAPSSDLSTELEPMAISDDAGRAAAKAGFVS